MNFAETPLWLDFAVLLAACAIAFEVGCFTGNWLLRRIPATTDKDTDSSDTATLSGVFGLLALLLAFSFGLALDRYEQRRLLVVAEANALSTFASRIALLDPASAATTRALLGEYAGARVAFGSAVSSPSALAAYQRGEALHQDIGAAIYASLAQAAPDPRGPALLQPYNEAGDIAAERLAAREARLPDTVVILLGVFCVSGAALLGYSRAGTPRPHRLASMIFLALLSICFVTVLDLDRPRSGTIQVPQTAMERQAVALRL